ncbi:hypothetical protein AVEN_23628-1 [Araneus ventricosus]|uniref:DUF4817 domain-containing protein n=1 Tax=Araneus ventricosus TaxID=182803 RepID=A0A4Y2BK03_ARAVE|nr:hypothetical protein AVEN_23628-1 [Araneus ventricosus]
MTTVKQKARLWFHESKSIVTVQRHFRLEYRNCQSPSSFDTESECEIDDDVDEVYDSISDETKLFTQSEINDLVRDSNLPKDSEEVLPSRLKEKKLLAPGTSFSWFRNRGQKFIPFVPQAGELVYCSDIPGLIASFKV